MCQLLLSGIGYVPTPNVHSDVWDQVESYTIYMLLACRLEITFTFSLKLIISFLVQLQHLLLPSLIVTSSQVRVSTPLPLWSCCISGLGPDGLWQTQQPSGDPWTSRSASHQRSRASCSVCPAPSAWWCGGLQQCVQGIPWCSNGSRWTCWGWNHLEAWLSKLAVLPWWLQDMLVCSAALSHILNPSTWWEPWGQYSYWRAARVQYWAQASWTKTSVELVGTQPLAWWLEKKYCTTQNSLVPKKLLLVPILHVIPVGRPGTEYIFGSCKNALLNVSRVLNSKCPKHSAK